MWLELCIGLISGLASGILGVGGAFLAILLMLFLLHLPMHQIVGTSLAMIVFTALAGSFNYFRSGHVDVRSTLRIVIPGMGGALLGAYLTTFAPSSALKIPQIIALLSLTLFGKNLRLPRLFSTPNALTICGFLIGVFSGFSGVGGGFLLVPFFLLLGLSSKTAVGSSLLGIFFLSLSGTAMHLVQGHVIFSVLLPLIVGSVSGALISSKLALSIPEKTHSTLLRVLFALAVVFLILSEIFL
jgi:uncharacterized protein